jgi:hypothetical protein
MLPKNRIPEIKPMSISTQRGNPEFFWSAPVTEQNKAHPIRETIKQKNKTKQKILITAIPVIKLSIILLIK